MFVLQRKSCRFSFSAKHTLNGQRYIRGLRRSRGNSTALLTKNQYLAKLAVTVHHTQTLTHWRIWVCFIQIFLSLNFLGLSNVSKCAENWYILAFFFIFLRGDDICCFDSKSIHLRSIEKCRRKSASKFGKTLKNGIQARYFWGWFFNPALLPYAEQTCAKLEF